MLEEKGLPFEVLSFEATDFTAEEVALKLGVPISCVYKTLVARADSSGVVMAILAGDRNLSLRKLARAIPDKKVDLVKLSELERLTGYLKGGCSPLGAKKTFPVFIDQDAARQEKICVSAGLRGLQIWIKPEDLIKAAGARVVDIAE